MAIKGIDVSSWQGAINWQNVKASGIKFAIIRAGYGREASQKDSCFEQNYKNAKAEGLDVGAYWYSYAESAADAVREARACLTVIKGKQFDLPVYFDLEEQCQFEKGKAFCDSIIQAFCGELEKNGYKAGLYCSASPLSVYVSAAVAARYPIWVAQYYSSCTYKGAKYQIWQYTDKGQVDGINQKVDMNQLIDDSIITKSTLTKKKKSIDKLAREVIAGKWGNGDTRKQRLIAAGYNYAAVQDKVNEIMSKKSSEEIAKEVIKGKWGNGEDRKVRLTAAGYDYSKVQAKVNELMKK